MRYPNYDAGLYPPPGISLVDAYTTLIGRSERDNQDEIATLPKGSTRRASMRIGRACLLGKRDPEAARLIARSARAELDPHSPRARADHVHHYRTLARLIERGDSPETVLSLRRDLHRQSIEDLQDARHELDKCHGQISHETKRRVQDHLGRRTEARTLASLNRQLHPWMMVVRALEHHDQHHSIAGHGREARAANFDAVLIESSPIGLFENDDDAAETARIHKLQIKSDCFGMCERDRNPRRQVANRRYFESVLRPRYNPDITLISGCCDFQLGRRAFLGEIDTLLADEYTDSGVADRDLLALDGITNHVLLIASAGEIAGRQGTFRHTPDFPIPEQRAAEPM